MQKQKELQEVIASLAIDFLKKKEVIAIGKLLQAVPTAAIINSGIKFPELRSFLKTCLSEMGLYANSEYVSVNPLPEIPLQEIEGESLEAFLENAFRVGHKIVWQNLLYKRFNYTSYETLKKDAEKLGYTVVWKGITY